MNHSGIRIARANLCACGNNAWSCLKPASRFYRNGADIAEATKETIAIVHRDVSKGDLSC